jgi:sugar lactone lactonase YvrE
MTKRNLGSALGVAILLAGCAPDPEPPAAPAPEAAPAAPAAGAPAAPPVAPAPAAGDAAIPDRIVAERGGFIPEGIEFDQANGRLLTGSLAEGSIFEVHNDGTLTTVVTDPELVSSVGIEVDEPRNRLLVANSDSAVFQGQGNGQAKLGVYNLTTGQRLAMVDLGATLNAGADAAFFCNDVTVADDGTIYATDTRQNVVYSVDSNYQPAVFYRFPPSEGLALNGLVHHADGYLLVADLGSGNIYKVPIDDPAATSQVMLAEPVPGVDGLVWMADGRLAAVSNSTSSVVALTSNDDWASAQAAGTARFEGQATTAAAVGDEVYVVQPHFADQEPPVILRAVFP